MDILWWFAMATDDDRGGRERPGKASTSAWSKGKPPSLGGDQKKVIESTEPVVSQYFVLTSKFG